MLYLIKYKWDRPISVYLYFCSSTNYYILQNQHVKSLCHVMLSINSNNIASYILYYDFSFY